MKIKKALAIILAALTLICCAACGGETKPAASGSEPEAEKVVVWSWVSDLEKYAEKYKEDTGKEVEVVLAADGTDNYSIKIDTALGARSSEVDIVCGEAHMLDAYYEGEYLADLGDYASSEDINGIVDFVVDVGTDDDGVIRALSYQMTPGSIVFRADIAMEVFGTDDPAEISKLFADYDTMIETAKKLREFNYYLFCTTADLNRYSSAGEPWVVDGKLNLSEARLGYLDAAVAMFNEKLVANAPEWSSSWYMSMGGPIPVGLDTIAADIWGKTEEDLAAMGEEVGTTQIFAYSLPTWGALIVTDYAEDLKGQYRVCAGPCSYFQGGTWMGINTYSENKDAAWEFIQWVTCNQETAEWWIEKSGGDVVSNKAALEAFADYENPNFGNQRTYEFYMNEAKNVDFTIASIYDTDLSNALNTAISNITTNGMSREEAIEDMKANISALYPELVID